MQILYGSGVLVVLYEICHCILWLRENSRAKAYRLFAAWALSNADGHEYRAKRWVVYSKEEEAI